MLMLTPIFWFFVIFNFNFVCMFNNNTKKKHTWSILWRMIAHRLHVKSVLWLQIVHALSVSLNKMGDMNYYGDDLQSARKHYARALDVRRNALTDQTELSSQVKIQFPRMLSSWLYLCAQLYFTLTGSWHSSIFD